MKVSFRAISVLFLVLMILQSKAQNNNASERFITVGKLTFRDFNKNGKLMCTKIPESQLSKEHKTFFQKCEWKKNLCSFNRPGLARQSFLPIMVFFGCSGLMVPLIT